MNVFFLSLYIIFFILINFVEKKLYRSHISPLTFYCLLWCIIGIGANLAFFDYDKPSLLVNITIIVSIVIVFIFFIIMNKNISFQLLGDSIIEFKVNKKLFFLLEVIFIFVSMPKFINSFQIFLTNGFTILRGAEIIGVGKDVGIYNEIVELIVKPWFYCVDLIAIISLSTYVAKIQEKGKDQISRPTRLLLALTIVAVPVLLIVKQPDYGTAITFIIATIFILFVAGIKKRYIITGILLVVILLPVLYIFVLPEHAKTRIDVFLNPNLDPRGAGYNVIQSKLAIGAGEFLGMGILKGNQTQLGFLYPKTTDFIFAVIGEEMGFIIAATVIITYVVLITRSIFIAKTAKNNLGSYIAIGIAGIFLFHMAENIGMTMGLLPITGVPLPFVSYGGSSLLTNLMMIGLLLNISGRRQKAIFID